ncbi:MAG: hypothetical protein JW720_07220 [Sedimentisphaerales bacterium]|nr:hypothetical protein [Sedimentisphaerales bacterium]
MERKTLTKRFRPVRIGVFAVVCAVLCGSCASRSSYSAADGPLLTRWAEDVSAKKPLPEYPRPQMVRKEWVNLNGLWDYAIVGKNASQPSEFDGEILVPYPVESALSGVMKPVGPEKRLWYRRTFKTAGKWKDKRVLLHFGAVDWDSTVWVNGKKVGGHKGGYDPFSFDITDALTGKGEQEIVVSVWDPTDAGTQPRGKQIRRPGGIWYTAVTGIWQTAWVEAVAETHVESIKITPKVDGNAVELGLNVASGGGDIAVNVEVLDEGRAVAEAQVEIAGAGRGAISPLVAVAVEDAKLWSPDSPFLYDLKITVAQDGKVVDRVSSYFGMRKIELKKDKNGINRLFLNNEALFQYGPLDQGWWPDGLYTAPSDEALRYDLEVIKKLGCNMLRKHVKVEPDRLYYWCDKLGVLVWQDMPSGDKYIGGSDPDIERTAESGAQFEMELKAMIATFYNHPSIIMWVPYNEGWGQWDTARIVDMIRGLDPTRLVNNTSGWADRKVGDVHDIHSYPGPSAPPVEENRAAVLGEFGGLGLPVKGHTWQEEKNWGYRSYEDREALTDAYVNLLNRLRTLIGGGLSAAVYTQTTDVEVEVNGFMTYDRAMIKPDVEKAAAAAKKLYLPPPIVKTIVPSSRREGIKWKYTMDKPADGWEQCGFDDSSWDSGPGGFGTRMTPGTAVRTEWNSSDIWIRRSFEIGSKPGQAYLSMHHDEDAEIYINGKLVKKVDGYTTGYGEFEFDTSALKAGKNCIAIHCRQTGGGQYIDAGIVELKEQAE